ncbi:MAG: sulfite exporter TauE/SafE family protein [Syntrophomonadaceae bacterium]
MTSILFVLALISGMLGLGVAFAAVPFLSLFLSDLVHQVQPISLLLNGVTAAFAAYGFSQSRLIDWRKALILAVATTAAAPVGSYMAQTTPPLYIWYFYLAAVVFLAYKLFRPTQAQPGGENFPLVVMLALPISLLSGFLGVGPGFLLMPTLILAGFETKRAAGINAVAVTPPSFSALLPHLSTAQFDPTLTWLLVFFGAVGSFAGAKITSLYLPSNRVKQLFGILIVVMTIYKVSSLLSG